MCAIISTQLHLVLILSSLYHTASANYHGLDCTIAQCGWLDGSGTMDLSTMACFAYFIESPRLSKLTNFTLITTS